MQIEHRKLHNILPAFRGPDNKKEQKFKIITVAIRCYLGFRPENFKGQLLKQGDYEKVSEALDELMLKDKKKLSHYEEHLRSAVKAVGEERLLYFTGHYLWDYVSPSMAFIKNAKTTS